MSNKQSELSVITKAKNLCSYVMTQCRLLTYAAQLSMDHGAILPKQYEQITQKVYEVMNLLSAWIKSDEKRFANRI